MRASPHTVLMNYVIGLCKKTGRWPTTLSDLGYEVQLIEKTIRTASFNIVKPDIIAVSNKHIHSLIFDCKGGGTIDEKQILNYKTLRKEDFINWIDIYSRDQFNFDFCISDFEKNHSKIMTQLDTIPIISFGDEEITKSNSFSLSHLNTAFSNPVSLKNMLPPTNYYPFSATDDKCIIIPHIIRGLVSIATERGRSGPDILSSEILNTKDVLERIHRMWPALSQEHQNKLKEKMQEIIRYLRDKYKDTFANQLKHIQEKKGYMIRGSLSAFTKTCENIINDCEKQPLLTDFNT